MEQREPYYPCKVTFSEYGPRLEEVLLRLLKGEAGEEGAAWRLPK